jgi:hypothetical protein
VSNRKGKLEAYLEGKTGLSILGIVEVLKDCPIEEFDQIVEELRRVYGQYVTWHDIPEIRWRLKLQK